MLLGSYFITQNGITAKRTSDTVVIVSGTPTDDVEIAVPNAVLIPVITSKQSQVQQKQEQISITKAPTLKKPKPKKNKARVNGKNVWDILKLKVADAQRSFVAGNDISIIEAYTAITANGHAVPFGIYENETPVGFLMVGFDVDDYWDDAPQIAKGNYNLWRLMIDETHQKKGFGKEAVRLALEFIESFPCGEAEYCWLSYEPDNEAARRLYNSFGFHETGNHRNNGLCISFDGS